ncbi:MAG: long-chain-fatty-acid--CoA ligase [Sphingobium sp.]
MQRLHDIVDHHGVARGDKIAFIFGERRTDFVTARGQVRRIARSLGARGIGPGDRIACLARNSDRFLLLLMGASAAGAVLVPLNWRLSPAELDYIYRDSEARLLFAGDEYRALAQAMVGDADMAVALEDEGLDAWLDAHDGPDPLPAHVDDVAVQLYTSGTTGQPKGVMLTHRALMEPRQLWTEMPWYRWAEDDVALDAMPYFHVGGLGWALMSLHAGMPTVILPEFDPAAVLRAIEDERVTKMFLVPSALHIVVRKPDMAQYDVSSLRTIIYGASTMPIDLLRECIASFGCGFVQNYGMTETCGVIAALEPADHDFAGNSRMDSAGKALPGVEIEIHDSAGSRMPQGEIGEIVIRSGAIMAGYWKRPEASGEAIDDAGWLRTGDAGYLDAEGYLHVHDRLKDMIISGGENIYAAEVENAIFGHPAVEDVTVIGLPDARWGEAVCAVVVAKPGPVPSHASIVDWARQRIAAYKLPKSTILIDVLPRNAAGKVLRRELRLRFAPLLKDKNN